MMVVVILAAALVVLRMRGSGRIAGFGGKDGIVDECCLLSSFFSSMGYAVGFWMVSGGTSLLVASSESNLS